MKKLLPTVACLSCTLLLAMHSLRAQSIGTFTTIEPTAQTPALVIPATHTFQRIIRTGTALTAGGTLGNNPDFTGYVPINGSSTNGYLSISSETAPAECAILTMSFDNTSKLWGITNSGKVNLPGSEIGICAAFCSGTVTARNTVIVGEEVFPNGDFNGDGYDDMGWLIEIDPATRTVINQDGIAGADKLWAMGRQAHENVAIRNDQTTAYWGADNITNGFIYKFVATVPGNFSSGNLYVLETTGLGSGTWRQIANATKPERNNTVAASTAVGAYNFQRIEDVEIGPDGKIYFASTATGRIYRFTDGGATVSNLEVFVDNISYDVDGSGPYAPVKFEWPDNLAFDGEGNLWVLQDGGDNHIWVIAPTHTSTSPAIRVFGNTPTGGEPTGITFSPDFKFLFISLQHPNSTNSNGQADAAGNNIIFDAPTTLVIGRKEYLGATTLAQPHLLLNLLKKTNGIEISYSVAKSAVQAAEIQRSVDGINFATIATVADGTSKYLDNRLPAAPRIYYRLRQCDNSAQCTLSETKDIKASGLPELQVYPLSGNGRLHLQYHSEIIEDISIAVYNNTGSEVLSQKKRATRGVNDFTLQLGGGAAGVYVVRVTGQQNSITRSFVKY